MSIAPDKRTVTAVFVKRLRHVRHDRGMTLIPESTRCVRAGDLHELVTTDQTGLSAGSRVDRTGFLGFVEVTRAGVIEAGDVVALPEARVGRVVGFDDCHFPNHYNIIIESTALLTGDHPSVAVEGTVRFEPEAASGRGERP
ncbi:DUF6917 domain-containing protein [Roseospira visakhapatnamensis]|uniref:DUF6917 domain-containing protein n=1 Tax=Roseospira visakhapatnamensis TaxID=390880 RepID=A0A7W6W8P0_9PROT|nr:hypothetical protein [Roseospira visakhapatnamensis]MBB4264587.1 hypothetical protein [Roseospira visakhapatnamensis]